MTLTQHDKEIIECIIDEWAKNQIITTNISK